MAAGQALNVVKQIEALADGPATTELRDCLGQLVGSLQFFLDHPDSRVRLGSARTLQKLARGFGEDFAKQDLSKARGALEKCRGSDDPGDQELLDLLEDTPHLGSRQQPEPAESTAGAAAGTQATSSSKDIDPKDDTGEIVLQVGPDTDGSVKAKILEKVISISGVVSVTFEDINVIVRARSQALADDPTFAEDIQSAIKMQGIDCSPGDGAGGAALLDDDDDAEPAYLDDEDGAEEVIPSAQGGASASAGGAPDGQPQWSFFSQSNWMTGRRVQEYDEDPTIAARLAKAKKRMEEKRKEEEGRLGRLSSWMGWGRS